MAQVIHMNLRRWDDREDDSTAPQDLTAKILSTLQPTKAFPPQMPRALQLHLHCAGRRPPSSVRGCHLARPTTDGP